MEATIASGITSVEHGKTLDFACKSNRTLSSEKDLDGDGLFNVVCYNGDLERQYLWPDSNEVCKYSRVPNSCLLTPMYLL